MTLRTKISPSCRTCITHSIAPAVLLLLSASATVSAQEGVLGGSIPFTGSLDLTEIADIGGRLTDLNHAPGDSSLFVVRVEGQIFKVDPTTETDTLWFDVGAAVDAQPGRTFRFDFNRNNPTYHSHTGLRAVAFHPEYNTPNTSGYGKFYTSLHEDNTSVSNPHYLGAMGSGFDANKQSVLVEWTFDFNTNTAGSYRELFRVKLDSGYHAHSMAKIRFNEYAEPGDEDYGLLYIAHGDSGTSTGQALDDVKGKLLRIDPLDPAGDARYTVPTSNVFAADNNNTTLAEVYARGFRNPHNFDFQKDSKGNVHLIVAGIGQGRIEELNLIENGKNYGWSVREGTFHSNGALLASGTRDTDGFTFPVAQFGHCSSCGKVAMHGGYVIPSGDNAGEYVFGDFASARLFHVTFDDLVTNVTEGPSEDLTQELIEEFNTTLDGVATTWDAITGGGGRGDARMGRGVDGSVYITSKSNGKVYLVLPAVIPEPSTFLLTTLGMLGLLRCAGRCRPGG